MAELGGKRGTQAFSKETNRWWVPVGPTDATKQEEQKATANLLYRVATTLVFVTIVGVVVVLLTDG